MSNSLFHKQPFFLGSIEKYVDLNVFTPHTKDTKYTTIQRTYNLHNNLLKVSKYKNIVY